MRPEELYQNATDAIQSRDWQAATAYAVTGLLGLHIGAFKGLQALGISTEFK